MVKKQTPTAAWETALQDALKKQAESGSEGMTKAEIATALKCGTGKAGKLLRQLHNEKRLVCGRRPVMTTSITGITSTRYRSVYSVKGKP